MYDIKRGLIMFFDTAKATLPVHISVENDIEVDINGNCQLLTLLFVGDDDEPIETRLPLDGVISNLTDYYREVRANEHGYMQLYAIANEFEKAVDELRDIASQLEDHSLYDDRQLDIFEDNDE